MSAIADGLRLESVPRPGRRPASFWRFEGAPAPGTGRAPLLAVHGLGVDGRFFRHLGPLARDRDLVLVNLPNDLPAGATMDDLADEALSALDAAGHGAARAVVLGSSFGGMVALAVALARPGRTAGLVLVGTAGAWADVPLHLRFLARVHPLVPRLPYPRVLAALMLPPVFSVADPAAREELRVQMLHRTKGFVGGAIGAMRGFDARGRLGGVAAPTLVVHGGADHIFPERTGRALAAAIPGARFVGIPSCGHLPPFTHPGDTCRAVESFLREASL